MPRTVSREGDLVRAVIQYLNARGAFAWRMNSGMIRGEHRGKPWAVRMGTRGMPDVLAVWPKRAHHFVQESSAVLRAEYSEPFGQLIAVECKRHPNKPTAAQEATMQELRKRGALVVVAYSVADVEKALA